MKSRKILFNIGLVSMISVLLSSCGPHYGNMVHGDYVNYHDKIKFRVPPHARVVADWAKRRGSGYGMEIDIAWRKSSSIYSPYLTDIWYEKVESYRNFISESPFLKTVEENKIESDADILNYAISEAAWRWERMDNFSILERKIFKSPLDDLQGHLMITFEYNDYNKKKEIMIFRFMLKKDFIIWIDYRNYADRFDRGAIEKTIDELVKSFELIS